MTDAKTGNEHIKDYLHRYLARPEAPHFAVMITGPWGIGKSYLVNNFLKSALTPEKKFIRVSLYGLSSSSDIDAEIFKATYPLLSSKGVKVVGSLFKTALRYVNVNLDASIQDALSGFKPDVLVFDDLERCDMDPNKVLGYINTYVEHDDCKVIIVANEAEITQNAEYRKRREKLIGRTMVVQSTFDEALESFITKIASERAQEFLMRQRPSISTVYHQAGLDNLRILQQTIWDFEPIIDALTDNQLQNQLGSDVVVKLFFALSFEMKAGRIEASDLRGRAAAVVSANFQRNRDNQKALPRLAAADARYSELRLYDEVLSDDVLVDALVKGIVDPDGVRVSIQRSSYYVDVGDEPAWRTVWHWFERSDADFTTAFAEMERQFDAREIVEPGEILHVFGLRLWLSDAKIIEKTPAELVKEGKKYIDDLYSLGRLEPLGNNEIGELRFQGFGGLGINHHETDEYKELFLYLDGRRKDVEQDAMPQKAAGLLKEMEEDQALFLRRLNYTGGEDSFYVRVPVLASMSPTAFIEAFFRLKPVQQRVVLSALKARYESSAPFHELSSEIPWLEEVEKLLRDRASGLPQIGVERANKMIEWYIVPIKRQFEAFKKMRLEVPASNDPPAAD